MEFNWIDWIIVILVVYQAWQGWEVGFFSLATNLLSFLVSLWIAVTYQAPVAAFVAQKFGIASTWSTVLSYIIIAFGAQVILQEILSLGLMYVPKKFLNSKFSNWVGALVSGLNGLVLISFFLILVLALPLRGTVKKDIQTSQIGSYIAVFADRHGGVFKSAVDQVGEKAVKFFTVTPQSAETITLDVEPPASALVEDPISENEMLTMVNAERAKVGVAPLVMDQSIIPVARAHSRDMFLRRYFSHFTPEGMDAGDRLTQGGVTYVVAGENLAYAPDLSTAHEGLMDSPPHKKNILDPQFGRIGVGIITTESYGMMVTQNFAD